MKMKKKVAISTIAVLALSAGVAFAFWQAQENDSEAEDEFEVSLEEEQENESETPDDPAEASEDFTGTDSGGGIVEEPYEGSQEDTGTASSSGRITLQSPSPGGTVRNGDSLRGLADVGTVHYRIVDHERGVIGQGELSVSNGKFSGSIQIRPYGPRGTIEVYSFDDSGREVNRVKIEVGFAQ